MNRSWRRYARFWGARVDADVDVELAFHIEMRVRDYVACGMSERDARQAAMLRLGNVDAARAACLTIGHRRQRRMSRAQTIDAFAQDVRYAVRTLSRQKAWTAVALVTMALGIGASTGVFSAVDGVILNPLPYRDAGRVVSIWTQPASGIMVSPDEKMLDAWAAQSRSFEGIERYGSRSMTLSGRGDAATVSAAMVAPGFARFAGVPLIAGRMFAAEEAVPNGARVVVIGEQVWRERFGASRDAVGQTLTLDDKAYTIIGIASSRLRLPSLDRGAVDAWLPLIKDTTMLSDLTVARLRKRVSREAAVKELEAIVQREHLAQGVGKYPILLVRPSDFASSRAALYLLSGAVALLLLVACANVAHLLLARGATRERELAIRVALGAGRWRIARQLLTESALLAAGGCVAGVGVAFASVRGLAVLRPESLNELAYMRIDARALWAAVGLSAIAGIAFGCTSALHALRRSGSDTLRTVGGGTGAPRTHAARSVLVISEMAVSALLLVGAALLIRSVVKLDHIDPRFDTRNLYAMHIELPFSHYPSTAERYAFIERAMRGAGAVPGVRSVTVSTAIPPEMGGVMLARVEAEGGIPVAAANAFLPMNFVMPSYFRALGIRLTGSTFSASAVERHEVIVNRGFARTYWPGQSGVGKRFRFKNAGGVSGGDWMTVIGESDDVPSGQMPNTQNAPLIYQPMNQKAANQRFELVVRTRDGIDPVPGLRRLVASIDPHLVPPPVTTAADKLHRSIAIQRFTMVLLASFASLAVVLSAVGLYGVISYVVTQRTREIGIRLALGATPRLVARAVVNRALGLSIAGLAIGLLVSVWATQLIRRQLYEVSALDGASYAAAGIILLGISVVACFVPMRRAMQVDPVIAMRGD